VRTNKHSLKWTSTLQSLRKRERWPCNNSRTKENLRAGNLIQAHLRYRKEVREASKVSLRTFCNSIYNLPVLARLHGALSRTKNQAGISGGFFQAGNATRGGNFITPTHNSFS
jgi:hypothetical protein